MELVFPTIEHKQAALDYRLEHISNNESHIHGSAGFIHAESYEDWLEKVTLAQTVVPPEFVTGTTYFAIVDGRIVGTISIRHYLNDSLIKNGGHIGYGVRPSERRKGYGVKMLALALEKCRSFGIEKALVTCDKNNIGSAKTIINNGGALENEITQEDGNILQRYWISLNIQ
jgi:predicted acetyltransferase